MEYDLIIKPEAGNDIKKALEWYKEEGEKLPKKLLDKINESLEKIQENPE
ncbi:type II toxin-antitoxin system RelE/ParE family toxin [Chryseobacterium gotjawalense]|uniref:Type II toxin-antitoxin system RelE/ParE family toxin n=1 Tax=Chryseobacterium gotjawalense TaxID=3042315 RepID=A0ABY8RF77_9FLAO|nr:type II toxin-antitoxin system RelE/ParE family toxin [Chryseobacterium sp. wdc7]WHF52631.1 type II toxin-antitoxin system RelE/ParE family toxin [Chryseobacterium sp. wdc7]